MSRPRSGHLPAAASAAAVTEIGAGDRHRPTDGASVAFGRDAGAYLHVVLTRWEGTELMNASC